MSRVWTTLREASDVGRRRVAIILEYRVREGAVASADFALDKNVS